MKCYVNHAKPNGGIFADNSDDVMAPHKALFFLQKSRSLRKHAYSNILKILPPENENFQIKNSDIFHISAQSIHCGYSLEPPR